MSSPQTRPEGPSHNALVLATRSVPSDAQQDPGTRTAQPRGHGASELGSRARSSGWAALGQTWLLSPERGRSGSDGRHLEAAGRVHHEREPRALKASGDRRDTAGDRTTHRRAPQHTPEPLFPSELSQARFLRNEALGQDSGQVAQGMKPDCHILERDTPHVSLGPGVAVRRRQPVPRASIWQTRGQLKCDSASQAPFQRKTGPWRAGGCGRGRHRLRQGYRMAFPAGPTAPSVPETGHCCPRGPAVCRPPGTSQTADRRALRAACPCMNEQARAGRPHAEGGAGSRGRPELCPNAATPSLRSGPQAVPEARFPIKSTSRPLFTAASRETSCV